MTDERLIKLFTQMQIVRNDGTISPMTEEEAAQLSAGLDAAKSQMDTEDWDGLRERLNQIPDLELESFGGHVPVQAEGTYQGEPLYFRSRYQHAKLCVGTTDGSDDVYWHARRKATVKVSGDDNPYAAGWIRPEEAEGIFRVLLAHLAERTNEDNEAELAAFSAGVERLVEEMRAKQAEATGDADPTD